MRRQVLRTASKAWNSVHPSASSTILPSDHATRSRQRLRNAGVWRRHASALGGQCCGSAPVLRARKWPNSWARMQESTSAWPESALHWSCPVRPSRSRTMAGRPSFQSYLPVGSWPGSSSYRTRPLQLLNGASCANASSHSSAKQSPGVLGIAGPPPASCHTAPRSNPPTQPRPSQSWVRPRKCRGQLSRKWAKSEAFQPSARSSTG